MTLGDGLVQDQQLDIMIFLGCFHLNICSDSVISSQKETVQQIKGIFRHFCSLALHSSLGASCLIALLIKKENQFYFTRFPREIAESIIGGIYS